MSLSAYLGTTSAAAGDAVTVHASSNGSGPVTVSVARVGAGNAGVHTESVTVDDHPMPPDAAMAGCSWPAATEFVVGPTWVSGLYRVTLTGPTGDRAVAELVVRPAAPAAPTLVCVPFSTFVAYAESGGASLYGNEDPARATRVSFDRPGVVSSSWEERFYTWFDANGLDVDWCSSLDLHATADLLDPYRLFVSIGHDEYWSAEMRDAVEGFVGRGGNAAFFSANTCWWQVRFEEGGRTMVCFKDAVIDPVDDRRLTTTRWFAAPVHRPENALTGVSFRNGAGCWTDGSVMAQAEFTARFAAHWVFEGTGLGDGDPFARSFVGYETDAAAYEEVDGIPRATLRDGTPDSFVILATADLTDWREVGQGGHATMGVFRRDGTVFTAATTGWGNGLVDPIVARITRNVVERLSDPTGARGWEVIGEAVDVRSMTACEGRLFAVTTDNKLWWRELVPQNVRWTRIGSAHDIVALAATTEAAGTRGIKLFGLGDTGGLFWRDPVVDIVPWSRIDDARDAVTMAAANDRLFAATADELQVRDSKVAAAPWNVIEPMDTVVAMTAATGRLFALKDDGTLWHRDPDDAPTGWGAAGEAPPGTIALAGAGGRLVAATAGGLLWWRDADAFD